MKITYPRGLRKAAAVTKAKLLLIGLSVFVGGLLVAQEKIQTPPPEGRVVKATLNGSEFVFDADTGGLLKLSRPVVGVLIEATKERSSLIDLAWPIPEFEPLRMATRFSQGAQITVTNGAVEIRWERLGLSRTNFAVAGNVSAVVRFTSAPDGQSVILTASVHNQSTNAVRQVLFPDLMGLVPVGGAAQTFLRTSLDSSPPFLELAVNEDRLSIQYMTDTASFSKELQSGGLFSNMGLRWLDYGGLKGGFSLFARRWGFDAPIAVRLHLSEVEEKLRLLCRNDVTLAPGGKWESGEFWLTPHTGGWAKGIEPFRQWVKQNYKRAFPLPKHVRDGIGYRTVWMCQNQPNDPQDPTFRFKDLPALAKECAAHGLDEMVLWSWNRGFQHPLPPPYPHLGTEQDMVAAVKACRELGVNVVPFISVLQANAASAPRYGLKVVDNNGWTFHTDLVPRWNPPYASGFACIPIPISNKLWHEDVLQSCRKLVDLGITSLSWDQYWTTTAEIPAPNFQTLTTGIREYARQRDPESTFSGEELWNLEIDSAYLDYTWNWGGYRDCRALTSVLPTPRINAIVSQSPLAVKKSFTDNLYLNIFPRKKESINGSDRIEAYPELSRALKQCAKLKKQFLPYFTEGKMIGDCILSEPCPGIHTTTYVLPDRLLMVLINTEGARKVEFQTDLAPWLGNDAKTRQIKSYNADGERISETKISRPQWRGQTPILKSGEMMLFEIVGQGS